MTSSAGSSSTPSIGEALEPSTPEQLALSDHLRQKGVVFYGAWWCPACFRQKNEFGKEAGNRLPYVECEKTDADRERCSAAGIRAFPTWVMGEQRVEGMQTIEQLKRWSGFSGLGATP
jgi:glutaredoxin